MQKVLRIGHRGAAGHAPENTLAAIRKGIALGVDFVEIDVRRTADGVLVVLHDGTVNRTTNGKGRVDRLCLRDIEKLNAGSGEHIPTLDEVLRVARGEAGLMLELKVKGVAPQTVEVVREAGFRDPVIYASFLHDELKHVRTVDPGASLMVLFGSLSRISVPHAMKYGPYVGLRHDKATRPLVDAFHRADLLVFVYTADAPSDIQHALSLDVDGIISNFPERIASQ
ncbi:MAG TPA: glycerophosphodiester phosphodiesterase family protein [Nitrospiraceae bacterium]|nr:glycerophosphodiester phosphodiesterase family protein [Nitrospiraceae bacterium]